MRGECHEHTKAPFVRSRFDSLALSGVVTSHGCSGNGSKGLQGRPARELAAGFGESRHLHNSEGLVGSVLDVLERGICQQTVRIEMANVTCARRLDNWHEPESHDGKLRTVAKQHVTHDL